MTIFYITKYALSGGIFAIKSEKSIEAWHKDGEFWVKDTRSHGMYFKHTEAFEDLNEAIADADARRNKQIASLKKQIAKLEKLAFAKATSSEGEG